MLLNHSSEWFIESDRRRREKMYNFVFQKRVLPCKNSVFADFEYKISEGYEKEFLVTPGFNVFILFCISYDFHTSPGSSQSRVRRASHTL